MKNKKVENIITAILAAAVLITGGMSLYSYLSEQKAKNEDQSGFQRLALFSGAGYQLSGGTGRGQQLLSEALF